MKKITLGILYLSLYIGTAVAKAPAEKPFVWHVSYKEGLADAELPSTDELLTEDMFIAFKKTGWTCAVSRANEARDLAFRHESWNVGCTRDGENMMAVTYYCADKIWPISPITLFSKNGKYQARVVVTCDDYKKYLGKAAK